MSGEWRVANHEQGTSSVGLLSVDFDARAGVRKTQGTESTEVSGRGSG
jgi:hypothetical protein